ncbi:hypothetical protein N7481_000166 [Penicillium waksmanii]|uniref:uncharacterized protein n=1 Tax=Penicillium waksmanii TaxID=69791 RepID=UPI00254660B5|nr:uncharacterized protein N7481_000166 [Penicillium waksmanii]KAJ5999757.1 hypothetical protein N7481_000166 [Penicillium waksmanii]
MLQCLEEQDGLMGSGNIGLSTWIYNMSLTWSCSDQHICPDPDSTAMACKTVYHTLGIYHPVQPMINAFEGEKNYFTYYGERDPSVSSNAHSNSEYYATLAVTQALTDYLVALSDERVEVVSERLLKAQIPLTIFQAVVRVLLRQNADGSWGSTSIRENTAHAVIILKTTWSLPFVSETLRQSIGQAVRKGQAFILVSLDEEFNDYSWNGKCFYGLLSISRAAALSAIWDAQPTRRYSQKVEALYQLDSNVIAEHSKLLRQMKYFAKVPASIIEASCVEAGFLVRELLETTRLEEKKNYDKGFVSKQAVICIAVNYTLKGCLGNYFVLTMIELIELVYNLDTLLDLELIDRSSETLGLLEKLVHRMFADRTPSNIPQTDLDGNALTLETFQGKEEVYRIIKAMESGKRKFLENPHVLNAGDYEQNDLLMELRIAFLAKISKSPSDVVCANPVERYLLEEFNRHVAIWGRLWNDYADVERDRLDSNLNTLDFPEFQSCIEDARKDTPDELKKGYLSVLIQHEEDLANETLERFARAIESRRAKPAHIITGLQWYMGINHALRELYDARAIYASRS